MPALRRGLCSLVAARGLVLPLELIDAARGVHQFLAAREERMAGRADLHADIALVRRARLEGVAAGANDVDFLVSGMNTSLHLIGGDSFRNIQCTRNTNPREPGGPTGEGSLKAKPEA